MQTRVSTLTQSVCSRSLDLLITTAIYFSHYTVVNDICREYRSEWQGTIWFYDIVEIVTEKRAIIGRAVDSSSAAVFIKFPIYEH